MRRTSIFSNDGTCTACVTLNGISLVGTSCETVAAQGYQGHSGKNKGSKAGVAGCRFQSVPEKSKDFKVKK